MKKTDHFCFTDNKNLNLWSEKKNKILRTFDKKS